MGENTDQRFFLGEAVFDDTVTDQEGMDTGVWRVSHVIRPSSAEHRRSATRFKHITEQGVRRSDAAKVGGDFDELAAIKANRIRSLPAHQLRQYPNDLTELREKIFSNDIFV
jgi:hypothetical protein